MHQSLQWITLSSACRSNTKTGKASTLNLYSVKVNIYQHPPPFPCCGPTSLHKRNFKNCLCFCQDIFPPRLTCQAHLKAVGQVILISPSTSPKHSERRAKAQPFEPDTPTWQNSVFKPKTFWRLPWTDGKLHLRYFKRKSLKAKKKKKTCLTPKVDSLSKPDVSQKAAWQSVLKQAHQVPLIRAQTNTD